MDESQRCVAGKGMLDDDRATASIILPTTTLHDYIQNIKIYPVLVLMIESDT